MIVSAEKPNITIETLPMTVGWRGESASLPCNIKGSFRYASWRKERPKPRIVPWDVLKYTNGTTISKDSRYSMDDNFGLIINNLEFVDESIFICEVVGINGYKLKNSTALTVNGMKMVL